MHELYVANQLLEKNLPDAEFDRLVKGQKLLHDCKQGNFDKLRDMGLIKFPKKRKEYTLTSPEKEKEIREKCDEINQLREDGMLAAQACKHANVPYQTYADWCSRFDIEIPSRKRMVEVKRVIELVNEGNRISKVAQKLHHSIYSINCALADKGYKYNKNKVEVVKL